MAHESHHIKRLKNVLSQKLLTEPLNVIISEGGT